MVLLLYLVSLFVNSKDSRLEQARSLWSESCLNSDDATLLDLKRLEYTTKLLLPRLLCELLPVMSCSINASNEECIRVRPAEWFLAFALLSENLEKATHIKEGDFITGVLKLLTARVPPPLVTISFVPLPVKTEPLLPIHDVYCEMNKIFTYHPTFTEVSFLFSSLYPNRKKFCVGSSSHFAGSTDARCLLALYRVGKR